MKTEECLRDPVFQLNLLLWMAKEQPDDGYRVRPVFRKLGYEVVYVEAPFAFPETTIQFIQQCTLEIASKPKPEIVLKHQNNGSALYFEAKANSFDPPSTTAKQARGHLLAVGPAFREVYSPLKTCLLCYVLPQHASIRMTSCLAQLHQELLAVELNPGPFSVHGLAVQDGNVTYSWDIGFKSYVSAVEDEQPIMEGVSDDTDPCPLLLVFSDEDSPNPENQDFYRRAMIEKTRARLLCDIQSLPIGLSYDVKPDDLLMKMTDGVFGFMGPHGQKGLRKLLREGLLKRIFNHWHERQSGIRMNGDVLTVQWQSKNEKEIFLDWLEDKKTVFDANKPADDGQMLIEMIQDSPGAEG